MRNTVQILFMLLVLTSCKDNEEVNDKVEDNSPKVGDVMHVETLFDETSLTDIEYKLLKELDICDTLEVEGSDVAPCSAEKFKFIKFNDNAKLEDAFLLQIKALTVLKNQEAKLPMRHLIVFEREKGALVKVNGFRGNLIATRESSSGVKDLIVRFYIPEDAAFLNCLFEWSDKRYHFKSVEAIDGGGGNGRVKEEFKDSISKIVYQSLMDNTMLF